MGHWRDHAACRGLDPALFFPLDDEDPSAALTVCAECAVRETCLDTALATREPSGVWGGATERERRRILRRRRRTA